jgi:hypothetical protein
MFQTGVRQRGGSRMGSMGTSHNKGATIKGATTTIKGATTTIKGATSSIDPQQ